MQKRLAPEESGALKRSIKRVKGSYKPDNANVRGVGGGGVEGDPELSVFIVAGDAEAWYARLVEFGTPPHQIKPKRRKAMKFGDENFATTINHPGAKHTPFFYPPVRALRRRVRSRITRATKKAVREIATS